MVDADGAEQCVSSQPQKVLQPLVTILRACFVNYSRSNATNGVVTMRPLPRTEL